MRPAAILTHASPPRANSPALARARTFSALLARPGATGPAARGIEPLDIAPRDILPPLLRITAEGLA
jgi:hypothetical protein